MCDIFVNIVVFVRLLFSKYEFWPLSEQDKFIFILQLTANDMLIYIENNL